MAAKFSHLGFKLKLHRKLMKLSIREAAREVNVSPSRMSQWERGLRRPGIESLIKMAVLYKVMVDELVSDMRQEEVAQFKRRHSNEEKSDSTIQKPKPT